MNTPAITARRIWFALLVAYVLTALFSPSAEAYKPYTRTPVDNLFTNVEIPPNESVTSSEIEIGLSETQGFDWRIVPDSGDPSINVVILQVNNSTDAFTRWTPLDGQTVTSDVTITTTGGGTRVLLAPSFKAKYQLNNTATVTANVTLRAFSQ